jgi:hypothetical protein
MAANTFGMDYNACGMEAVKSANEAFTPSPLFAAGLT